MGTEVLAVAAIIGAATGIYSAVSAANADIPEFSYTQPTLETPDYSGLYASMAEQTAMAMEQTQAISDAIAAQTSLLTETMANQQAYLADLEAASAAEAAAQEEAEQRRINLAQTGRNSTILTGGTGLEEGSEPVKKKKLLGE